jgi:hypothetical protein
MSTISFLKKNLFSPRPGIFYSKEEGKGKKMRGKKKIINKIEKE